MFATLCWLQCGGCGGDTTSLLNADSPDIPELPGMLGTQALWHPPSSTGSLDEHRRPLDTILSKRQTPDILRVEGVLSSPDGPDGVAVLAVDETARRASAVHDHSAGLGYLLRVLPEMCEGTILEILLVGAQRVPSRSTIATGAETSLTIAADGHEQDWLTNTVRTGARP